VRREAAVVDEHDARDAVGALQRQPACRVAANGVADYDGASQVQSVGELDEEIAELDGAQRGGGQGRLTVTWPVESQQPAPLSERLGDGDEIGAVVQRRVQQHHRRAGALVGVGNRAE
jgi:hypothetical protein